MTEKDFEVVCSKIDEDKEFLNNVSQEIWKMPELLYNEVHAHAVLTRALYRRGFKVQKHYFMPTAFRAEYCSKSGEGTTVAILLEYDALPDIGHACGHNLIAEAGLAAAFGVKEAMEQDSTIKGKLIVLGTPAEEGGGGKIKLIELDAFDGVDVALMVHPSPWHLLCPQMLSCVNGSVIFKGKESHAAAMPWKGINALDAAIAFYQNVAFLRQQIKSTSRISVIITNGGAAVNVIPAESSLDFLIRAPSMGELNNLRNKVEACITSAAQATGCEVEINFKDEDCYENLITNKILINLYKNYLERLGVKDIDKQMLNDPVGSTDMGNVSHKIPSFHPLYAIPCEGFNHTKPFNEGTGAETAQEPTLQVSKAMAMTALHALRYPEITAEAKKQLMMDLMEDLRID